MSDTSQSLARLRAIEPMGGGYFAGGALHVSDRDAILNLLTEAREALKPFARMHALIHTYKDKHEGKFGPMMQMYREHMEQAAALYAKLAEMEEGS